jgi:hypothetical protein
LKNRSWWSVLIGDLKAHNKTVPWRTTNQSDRYDLCHNLVLGLWWNSVEGRQNSLGEAKGTHGTALPLVIICSSNSIQGRRPDQELILRGLGKGWTVPCDSLVQ